MGQIFKAAIIVCFGSSLVPAAAPTAPVYFIPADTESSGCSVLGQQGALHISSDRLDFGAGSQQIDFPRANRGVSCTIEGAENRLSVFTGRDPWKWRSHLPISKRIRFRSVYPGIDIVYYGNGSRLEYDFEIASRASASRIRLGFAKTAELEISSTGDLRVTVNSSILIQHRPIARQGDRRVNAKYVIDKSRNQARIEVGPYDHSRPLTIDPVLAWETSANRGGLAANAVAADAAGNFWILADYPGSNLTYTKTFGPGGAKRELLLLKVDPTGTQLLYAVLLGGSGGDYGRAVAMDKEGNAYLTGYTDSTDFPVTEDAFETTSLGTNGEAFVVKLSPKGDSLVYSTYLGGAGGANGAAIAVDSSGNAYVAGSAGLPGFPLTKGSWEDQFTVFFPITPGAVLVSNNGFVAKINTTGSALLYSTLLNAIPLSIALNRSGAAYILGSATGADLPAPIQFTQNPTKFGTVVIRVTPDGSSSDLNIFVGCLGSLFNTARLIALDSKSDIVVAGSTGCETFPYGTDSALQPQHAPGTVNPFSVQYDGLIVKIAPDGSSVLAATFLGGTDVDQIAALSIASDDSILVTGATSSSDFPTTVDAIQPKYSGGEIKAANIPGDGFFAHLSPNFDRLIYSTYLGGSGADYMLAMALDLADNAYLGGFSSSALQTPDAFSFGSPGPLWALKLGQDTAQPPTILSVSPLTLTAGSSDSTIQLNGTNFASNAVVLLDGASIPTTFQSATQVTAVVNAASLATTGLLELRVLNPGSGASNAWALPVIAASGNDPTPKVASLLPSGLPAGSAGQNIEITGTGFISSTIAAINGSPRAASLNNDGTLSVSLTTADLSTPGKLNLTLANPGPVGGVSPPVSFLVAAALVPTPPPGLSRIAPSTRPAGTSATTLTVSTAGTSASTVVRWNGVDHAISKGNLRDYSFTASAADLAHAGTVEVTLFDKATGMESNPLPFWIPFTGQFTDMAWNAANGLIYLSGPNLLTILNPDTGDAAATVSVDIQATRLVISPDGSYLYMGSMNGKLLRRYQLMSGAPWLGSSLDLPVNGLIDFVPVPSSPGSVAVFVGNGFQNEVSVYDGAVKRAMTAQVPGLFPGARALTFSADGQTLYYVVADSSVSLSTMAITSGGVGPAVTKGTANSGAQAATYFQGRVYTSSGAVFDGTTLAQVGQVPAVSYALPLVNSHAIVMIDGTSQYVCALQAFDAMTFLPLWEEHVGGGCDVNYYPYSKLFDIGAGRIAFRMTNAYIVKEPSATPFHSVNFIGSPLVAALEVGTNWVPQNEVGVLSPQSTVPATAFLYPNQPGSFTLGPANERNHFYATLTPAPIDLEAPNAPAPLGEYTGTVAVLLSNSTNAPITTTYDLSIVNLYPLQASVSSLAFTCPMGAKTCTPQSFSLTKKGKPFGAYLQTSTSWLTALNSDNGPPETITVAVNPAGLASGTYTANLTMGYYSSPVPPLVVPVTLTIVGPPSISNVLDAESANHTVVPGEWVAIYGSNLAGTTRAWAASDFGSGNTLPTSLDGVSVQFGGTPAAVFYVSPTQVDAQVPSGVSGNVPVTVTFDGVVSSTSTAAIGENAPSLFMYAAGTNLYPAATHLDGTLIGDPVAQPEATKAKAGEQIVLYVNGLAASPGGVLISAPVPYSDPITVAIGTEHASVSFAGLVAAGQFQVNVQVPTDLVSGNYAVSVTARGQVSLGTVILPVE